MQVKAGQDSKVSKAKQVALAEQGKAPRQGK
jgi:hypothetical protein